MGLQTILSLINMAESSPIGLKTRWEKEKLLVTSNFSFSHSVFNSLLLQTCKNQGLFGKRLNTVLNASCQNRLYKGSKSMEKLCRIQVLSIYYTSNRNTIHNNMLNFLKIIICKIFSNECFLNFGCMIS